MPTNDRVPDDIEKLPAEQQRIEEVLQQSQAFLQTIIDSIPDPMLVINRDHRTVFANRAAREMAGGMDPVSRCLTCYWLAHQRDLPCAGQNECPLHRVVENKTSTTVMHTRHGLDGKETYIEVVATPVLSKSGEVGHVLETRRDITERQRQVETLRQSEEQFRRAIEDAPIPVIMQADDGEVLQISRTWTELTGYALSDLPTADTWLNLAYGDGGNAVRSQMHELLSGGRRAVDTEFAIHTRDGQTRHWSFRASSPGTLQDGRRFVVGMAVDITARKQAEETLRRTAEDLARSNEDLAQFASVVSHDLQEPLRTVKSFVQLLKNEYGDQLDANAGEYIDFAVDGVQRMQTLIRDLLAYSRIDTRAQQLLPMRASAAMREALDNLYERIQETRAEITCGELPTIRADPSQLAQLFQNLLGNALKFHNEAAPKIHVDASREGDYWRFSVRDNGIGIDARFQTEIFEIFRRLHTHQRYAGTGVGLAICKRIVDRHGGRIWVDSQPGHGATFYFTFPT